MLPRLPLRVRALSAIPLLGLAVVATLALTAIPALAGQASSGELLFYPCTSCHPVAANGQPTKALPNGFKGHGIVLVAHDKLGKGAKACLVCHDDPTRDPGKLKLVDGSLVDVTGDVSSVCYRCHADKYKQWKAGEHGKRQPKCTSAGCHDPHSPSYIYAGPLLPFVGTGFQTRAVSERTPFPALATPPVAPAVETPGWFRLGTSLGTLLAAGLIGSLVVGRPKR